MAAHVALSPRAGFCDLDRIHIACGISWCSWIFVIRLTSEAVRCIHCTSFWYSSSC
ncbi:hypothetical protein HanIR_Chr12g0593931 [Helianthus annuus]|nr:hypothetical protein HanIR_Chr12g0593931 [Helianthus annuus]